MLDAVGLDVWFSEGCRQANSTVSGRRDATHEDNRQTRSVLPAAKTIRQSSGRDRGSLAGSQYASTPPKTRLAAREQHSWLAIHLRSTLISHRTHTGTRCRDPRVNSHDDTPPVSSRTLLAQLASVKASSFSATWPSRQVYAAGGFSREKRTETKGWRE